MSDVDPILVAEADGGVILGESESERFDSHTCHQRGREQTRWIVDRAGEETTDYSLAVWEDGVVEAMRSVPYDGQRRFSTVDRPNRADKTSQFRLSVEGVLDKYVMRGEPEAHIEDLRERVLAVLDRDDVAANNNGEIDLLADIDERV